MFNNIKATIFKLRDLTSIPQLKALVERTKLTVSSWRVAVATDAQNNPVMYVPIEKVLMLGNYVTSNPETTRDAGIILYDAIAALATQQQITRILVEVPNKVEHQPDEKWIRVVEILVPQAVATQQMSDKAPSVAYVN